MIRLKCNSYRKEVACFATTIAVAGLALSAPLVPASEERPATPSATERSSSASYGSGKQYKTTVQRRSEGGELSAEDLHQASLLSSQLLLHLNAATEQLINGWGDAAKPEIEKAESLAKVVRAILPTTIVTTTVKDAVDKEIYRDEQRVQDDQIPIFSGAIALEVVEPIVAAKKDEAALKGLKLADADLIHTAVLVDLSYIERKLKRASELISTPKDAAAELALAQTVGVRFSAHKEDHPLVDVQHALRLAERMVREKKFEGAKANLQIAKLRLDAYRGLVDEAAAKPVAELTKEIEKLSVNLQGSGVAENIRGMWEKATGWFKREPGQVRETTAAPTPAEKKEVKP